MPRFFTQWIIYFWEDKEEKKKELSHGCLYRWGERLSLSLYMGRMKMSSSQNVEIQKEDKYCVYTLCTTRQSEQRSTCCNISSTSMATTNSLKIIFFEKKSEQVRNFSLGVFEKYFTKWRLHLVLDSPSSCLILKKGKTTTTFFNNKTKASRITNTKQITELWWFERNWQFYR